MNAVLADPAGAAGAGRARGWRTAARWATKGGFAVLDQGLISGSNFVMGILLARWLLPDQYGAYSLAFSIFLLLSIVHQAVLLEPMMVFGGAAEVESLRGYLRVLTRLHWIVVVAMFGALAITARFVDSSLSGALAGAAIAGPCVLIFWLLRRAFYLDVSVGRAALSALIYCVFLVCGSFLLEWRGLISPFTAFVAMAVAALATSGVLYLQLQRALPAGEGSPGFRDTCVRHWKYGRWALASAVAGWVPAYVYYPLLGSFSGMIATAELRALMNFVQPLAQFYAALSAVFLPYAARVRARDPRRGSASAARNGTLLFMAATLCYWAAILLFRRQILHLLYGEKYGEIVNLIPAIALGSVLWSGTIGASIVLRAMEAPDTIFKAYGVASFVSVAAGLPLTRAYSVLGAVWAMNLSDAVALALIVLLIRQRLSRLV